MKIRRQAVGTSPCPQSIGSPRRLPTRIATTDSVLVNCPFDADCLPLFEVILFTVSACGFVPRCALEEADGGDVRIDKLLRLIRASRYAIHDISAVGLDQTHGLPRFNRSELAAFATAWPEMCEAGHLDRNALSYPDLIGFIQDWLARAVGQPRG